MYVIATGAKNTAYIILVYTFLDLAHKFTGRASNALQRANNSVNASVYLFLVFQVRKVVYYFVVWCFVLFHRLPSFSV